MEENWNRRKGRRKMGELGKEEEKTGRNKEGRKFRIDG